MSTMARYILNEQVVRGVNVIETMFYPATSPARRIRASTTAPATPGAPARAAGRAFGVMRDPGWPALMEYSRR